MTEPPSRTRWRGTQLAEHFRQAAGEVFGSSGLYRALCPAVADSEPVLDLLRHRRAGQQPSYLLFGAVHYLLLAGAQHELRSWYGSLVTEPAEPSAAGAAFIDFCLTHQGELSALIGSRLVQTNVVRRSVALKYALWVVGQHCSQPLHLIEVGASAGLQLRVDRYRYLIGGQRFGPRQAPVTVDSNWIGNAALPDLDQAPPIASRTGIDLHPVDATDPDQRRWLRALIWPEHLADAALLERALDDLAANPVAILRGDAAQLCPSLAEALPAGEPRLVYHAATRMHVPLDQRAAFDNALDRWVIPGRCITSGRSRPARHITSRTGRQLPPRPAC